MTSKYGAIQTTPGGRSRGGRDMAHLGNNDDTEEIQPLLITGDERDFVVENHPPHSQNASAAADFASNGIGGSEVVIDDDDDEDILVAGGADVSGSSQRSSFKMRVSSFFRLWSTQDEEKKLSNCDTIFHLLKGNIGTGILAMPDALKNSGLLVGTLGLVLMSMVCIHCMHMLVRANHRLKALGRLPEGREVLTYPDVMELTVKESSWRWLRKLSKASRVTINVFLCMTQWGFCCVYFVFVSQNVKLVLDHHFGTAVDYHVVMAFVLPLVIALCSVKELKQLAPVSVIANVIQSTGLALTFVYLLQDIPHTWERNLVADLSKLPLFFGTAIYAFEGIGVVLPVENQMETPHDLRGWNGVLNTSMIIVTCLYIAVGFFGYLKYGDAVLGSVTLNLPVDQWLAQTIILLMAIAIFLSYALQFYVPLEVILPPIKARFPGREMLVEYGCRYAVVLFTFALAAAIPNLSLFISLVGALSSSSLALLFPTVIDSMLFWDQHTSSPTGKLVLAKNAIIFLVGFLGFVTGTFYSVRNIIDYFESGAV